MKLVGHQKVNFWHIFYFSKSQSSLIYGFTGNPLILLFLTFSSVVYAGSCRRKFITHECPIISILSVAMLECSSMVMGKLNYQKICVSCYLLLSAEI